MEVYERHSQGGRPAHPHRTPGMTKLPLIGGAAPMTSLTRLDAAAYRNMSVTRTEFRLLAGECASFPAQTLNSSSAHGVMLTQ